ncbi:MAG: hypothetical protein C0402_13555 [Thermodesulfovibrio sp.]|nr:hypothetical protein [Thermodesulfovibrio sp.]
MARLGHIGGETVSKGNYWNLTNGQRVILRSEGQLPGDGSVTYYRINPVFILAAGPVIGLLYAAFLPFIGLAIAGKVLVTKMVGKSADEVSKVATFNWTPSESYLAGKQQKGKDGESKKTGDAGSTEEKPDEK